MPGLWKRLVDASSLLVRGHAASHSMSGAREADDDTGWHRASLSKHGGLGGDTLGGSPDTPNRPQVVQMARKLLKKNPFLQTDVIDTLSACVVGSGIVVKAANKTVQGIIDDFLTRNAIGARYQHFLYGMLLLEGELILPLTFGYGGNLSTTYLYTDMVTVNWSPNDNRLIDTLVYQPTSSLGVDTRTFQPIIDITNKQEFFDKLYENNIENVGVNVTKRSGEEDESDADIKLGKPKDIRPSKDIAIYFKINDLASRRGLPAIFTLGDFADMFDEFVYKRLQLLQAVMRLWLDVEIDGGPSDVIKLRDEYKTIPANGAVDVHNTKVKTEVKKFSLDGTEIGNDFETFKTAWGLTTGVPPGVILGEKPIEAGSMFQKTTLVKQAMFGDVLRLLVDCQLSAKVAAGVLPRDANLEYELIFNEISTKDVGKLATAINQISLALLVGIQEEFIDRKDAAKAYVEAVAMALDCDLEANTEFSEEVDAPAMPPTGRAAVGPDGQPIAPGGGGGASDKRGNAFDKFTKRGARTNNFTKTKVTR